MEYWKEGRGEIEIESEIANEIGSNDIPRDSVTLDPNVFLSDLSSHPFLNPYCLLSFVSFTTSKQATKSGS